MTARSSWSDAYQDQNPPQAYFSNPNIVPSGQNSQAFFHNFNVYPQQEPLGRPSFQQSHDTHYNQQQQQQAVQRIHTGIADPINDFHPGDLQSHYGGPQSSPPNQGGWGQFQTQSQPPGTFPSVMPGYGHSHNSQRQQQPQSRPLSLNGSQTPQVVTIQPGALTDQQAPIKYHLPKSNMPQEVLGGLNNHEGPSFTHPTNTWDPNQQQPRTPNPRMHNSDPMFQDFEPHFPDSLQDTRFPSPQSERMGFSDHVDNRHSFSGPDRLSFSEIQPDRHSFSGGIRSEHLPFDQRQANFSSPTPLSPAPFSPPLSPPYRREDSWFPHPNNNNNQQQPMNIDQSPRRHSSSGRTPMSPQEEIQPPSRAATAPTTSSSTGKKRTKKLASSQEQPQHKSRRTSSSSKANRQQSLLVFSSDSDTDKHSGKHKLSYDTPPHKDEDHMVDQKQLKPIPFPPMDPTPREVRALAIRSQKEDIAKYRALADNIESDLRGLGKEIERTTDIGLGPDRAAYLVQYTAGLLTRTTEAITVVYDIPEYNLLEAPEIPLVESCLQNLRRCRQQLLIYERELSCLSTRTLFDPPAVLFVQCVPFPATIQQFHPCDTEVRLLTGACTKVRALGPVKAEICNSTFSQKRGQGMKGYEAQLDTFNIAKFNQLTFTLGTGCKTVQLKFTLELQYPQSYGHGTVTLTTAPTETFLVTTHTRQWASAEGEALKRELFMARTATGEPVAQENWDDAWRWSVPQEYFCNCIQKHYLQATRQEPNNVVRGLHPEEMLFIMKKFDEKERKRNPLGEFIDNKEYDQFWDWFGVVLQKIRHQHFLLPMWTQGLFWGFLSKAQSEQVLDKQDVGVFLLRFSESSPGTIAVSYKQSPVLVRHYLFKGCDPGQKGPSLPQFIRETNSLKTFLLIKTPLEFTENRKLFLIEKNHALQKIGVPKKKPPTTGPPTYDPHIEELQQSMDELVISSPETY